jgi:hypothetical protein
VAPSSASHADQLRAALGDIIDGRHVKRARHELLDRGEDLTALFISELDTRGYLPTTVARVRVEPGERVPAFLIERATAYFGWVFWEQFTSWKLRKLWGSVIKNQRGDWATQISPAQQTIIYANESLKLEMDIEHPSEF